MIVRAITVAWGAQGESLPNVMFTRPMVWGPREVGGAELRAERL